MRCRGTQANAEIEIARKVFTYEPDDERPELPFAHLLDSEDPAYAQITMAIVDLALELGPDSEMDEETVKLAIRIGRRRYNSAQPSSPTAGMPPQVGLRTRKTENANSVVYYVRRGAMVKIGTTMRLRDRMSALRPEEVLAIEPGGYRHEAEMHRRFAALRVPGQREWFYAGRELQEHIEHVLDRNGPPPPDLPTLPSAGGILEA